MHTNKVISPYVCSYKCMYNVHPDPTLGFDLPNTNISTLRNVNPPPPPTMAAHGPTNPSRPLNPPSYRIASQTTPPNQLIINQSSRNNLLTKEKMYND